jgi:hypothetical protein
MLQHNARLMTYNRRFSRAVVLQQIRQNSKDKARPPENKIFPSFGESLHERTSAFSKLLHT